MDDDNLSCTSFVSSISASSIHHPRPPDGPKPSSQGFHKRRTGKIIRSPYLATSTPYPNNTKQKSSQLLNGTPFGLQHDLDDTPRQLATKSNSREWWARAAKAAGGSSAGRGNAVYLPHPSASVFLQSLMKTPSFSAVVASKKRKRTQSASTSVKKKAASAVGEDGKDAIALRDELVELKKGLNEVTQERDLLHAKCAKLEQALGRKDKEITDLLASGHITSRDATRSLANSSSSAKMKKSSASSANAGAAGSVVASGSGAVIASLRGKIHSLERALREKESALAAMKREVNVTSLRELEIQCEVYCEEINRLREILLDHASPHKSSSPYSQRDAQVKLRALNQATVELASELEKREAENKRLKHQLERFQSESRTGGETITHSEQGLRGSIADRYVDHKRSELLSAIVDLELRLQEKEGALESVCKEMDQRKSHYERRIGELSGSHSDANNRMKLLEDKLSESEISHEKLKNIIRKLKDDRTHWRTAAEGTQSQLQEIQEKLEREGISKKDIVQELEALREKHQNEVLARDHARQLAKRRSQLVMTQEKERREAAAVTIQQQWRKRQAIQRQSKFHEATEQGILNIQSAVRGHLARKKLLSHQMPPPYPSQLPLADELGSMEMSSNTSDGESSESSLAVERIQAALRGHAAREMALKDLTKLNDQAYGTHTSTGNSVLRGGVESTLVAEMWTSSHPKLRPAPSSSMALQPHVNYNPLNRAHHPHGKELKQRTKPASQHGMGSRAGPGLLPWYPHSSDSSGDDDDDNVTQHSRQKATVENGPLPAPSLLPFPDNSFGSNSESNGYEVNSEAALLVDELT